MTDKCRGGPTERQEIKASHWPRNQFYWLLHLSPFTFLTQCIKKYLWLLFCSVTTISVKYKFIKKYYCNHKSVSIVPYAKWVCICVSKTATEDHCQKPETSLDKWRLRSNGKIGLKKRHQSRRRRSVERPAFHFPSAQRSWQDNRLWSCQNVMIEDTHCS